MATYKLGEILAIEKELAQVNPAATTATTLYTCPSGKKGAKDVFVTAVELSNAACLIRVWVAKAGAADDNKQYKAFGLSIGSNGIAIIPIGGLEAGDLIRVYASTTGAAFTANGVELQ